MDRLAAATQTPHHAFRRDEFSVLDEAVIDRTRVHGAKQLTDAFLLALALRNAGRFVTFDAGVPSSAVRGATEGHLVVL